MELPFGPSTVHPMPAKNIYGGFWCIEGGVVGSQPVISVGEHMTAGMVAGSSRLSLLDVAVDAI